MKEPFKPAEKQNRLLQDKARGKKKCNKAPIFFCCCFYGFFFLQEEMSEGQNLRWGGDRRGARSRVGAGGQWELPCDQRCGADLGRNV